MKVFQIEGKSRPTGKASTKKVRNSGEVPCVLYGNGDPIHFSVDKIAIRKALYTPDVHLVKVSVNGKEHDCIVRDAQFHPVFEEVQHIDFFEVKQSGVVETELPVLLVGTAEGTTVGGRLQQMARRLKVKGVLSGLPERIEVDVTNLGLGKTIRVDEVKFDKFEITSSGATPIAMVDVPRAAKTAVAETAK